MARRGSVDKMAVAQLWPKGVEVIGHAVAAHRHADDIQRRVERRRTDFVNQRRQLMHGAGEVAFARLQHFQHQRHATAFREMRQLRQGVHRAAARLRGLILFITPAWRHKQ